MRRTWPRPASIASAPTRRWRPRTERIAISVIATAATVVLACDEASGTTGAYAVIATIHHTDPAIVLLDGGRRDAGDNTGAPALHARERGWVDAVDLRMGEDAAPGRPRRRGAHARLCHVSDVPTFDADLYTFCEFPSIGTFTNERCETQRWVKG